IDWVADAAACSKSAALKPSVMGRSTAEDDNSCVCGAQPAVMPRTTASPMSRHSLVLSPKFIGCCSLRYGYWQVMYGYQPGGCEKPRHAAKARCGRATG